MLSVFGASSFVAYRAAAVSATVNAKFTIGVLAGAVTFHLASLATGVCRAGDGISAAVRGLARRPFGVGAAGNILSGTS